MRLEEIEGATVARCAELADTGGYYQYDSAHFMGEGIIKHLADMLESLDVVVACVDSSMTCRIRNFIGDPFAEDLPLPSNFQFDGRHGIKFDFPEVYTAPDGRELMFDTLMLNAFEKSLGLGYIGNKHNVRHMNPLDLCSVQIDDRRMRLDFQKDDSYEWFEFAILLSDEFKPHDDVEDLDGEDNVD